MMKKLLHVLYFSLTTLMFAYSQNAYAHSLWIEKNSDGSLGVCFGEFAQGLREKSGGKLDKIAHLEAWSVNPDGKREILNISKSEDQLGLENKAQNVIVQELSLPIKEPEAKEMGKQTSGKSKSFLYARFSDGTNVNLKPEFKLDVLPIEPGKAQIFFEGKPLAEKKVILTANNGWGKELKSDAQGIVSFDQPWPGLYVIDVNHIVEKSGKFNEQDYEIERHHVALSLEKS